MLVRDSMQKVLFVMPDLIQAVNKVKRMLWCLLWLEHQVIVGMLLLTELKASYTTVIPYLVMEETIYISALLCNKLLRLTL